MKTQLRKTNFEQFRSLTIGLLLGATLMGGALPGYAQGEKEAAKKTEVSAVGGTKVGEVKAEASKADPKKADPKKAKLEELSLNDIQDLGLLLDFIQEQSINVYEEASRIPVALNSGPDIRQINKIPYTLDGKDFLPPRQEWLVFFVGTVEPVIRQLGQEVKDMASGNSTVVVPGPLEKALDPLFISWSKDTEELNHHLDELVAQFDDAPNHAAKIRDLAVACFDDAGRMEQSRRKLFAILRSNAKQGGDKVLITPP